jgi:hypothetical protein
MTQTVPLTQTALDVQTAAANDNIPSNLTFPDDPFSPLLSGQKGKTAPIQLSEHAGIYEPPISCPIVVPHDSKVMTIIDSSGVHQVWVQLCQCPSAKTQRE